MAISRRSRVGAAEAALSHFALSKQSSTLNALTLYVIQRTRYGERAFRSSDAYFVREFSAVPSVMTFQIFMQRARFCSLSSVHCCGRVRHLIEANEYASSQRADWKSRRSGQTGSVTKVQLDVALCA